MRPRDYSSMAGALTAILLAALVGCTSRDLDKVVVRGTVLFAGKPLPHGQIRFIPIGDTKGPISGGVIKDGTYIADGKGGVPLGHHRVEIYGYRPANRAAPAAFSAEGGASEQYLPGKYNGGSGLEVTVTADSGSRPIDFDLEQ
jgi:hypothetical protein